MLFNKPPEMWTSDDVQALVDAQVSEGEILEFKQEFPWKKEPNKWNELGQLNEYGKDKICAEVSSFANTKGGYLVLGVEETENKPAKAKRITPLKNCHQLAALLLQVIGDSIDPRIPGLNCHAIPFDDKGSGVVVIFVPKSPHVPHRSRDKECYLRRGEQSLRLSMREVQQLASRVDRGQFDGLWTANFIAKKEQNVLDFGGGVVIFDRGRIFGGDSATYYLGWYNVIQNTMIADLHVTHYFDNRPSIWGDSAKVFAIKVEGVITGDRIVGKMLRIGFDIEPELTLIRRELLPSMRE